MRTGRARRLLPAATLVAAALTLGACSSDADNRTHTAATDPGATYSAPAPQAEPAAHTPAFTGPAAPLTGAPTENGVPNRPALAVKIDNVGSARGNQVGLGVADLVFEEVVEHQATRFVAVFHSRDSDPVGPIRSARTQDIDLLTSLRRPLFAFSGGNDTVTRAVAESSLIDLNASGRGRGYYRARGVSPHNLFNSTQRLWEQTPGDNPGPPPAQFSYLADGVQIAGEPASTVNVRMGAVAVRWEWDAGDRVYRRSQDGSVHRDAEHGPLTSTNVVVLGVEYGTSAADVRSPEAHTLGNGPLWVFSDGQVRTGRWVRSSNEEPPRLIAADGSNLALRPGNTWIELAPGAETPNVTVTP